MNPLKEEPQESLFGHQTPGHQGRRLKQLGMALADAHAPADWKEGVDQAIDRMAATGKEFTADDVRAECGDPPAHPNAFGARFSKAYRAKRITRVGFKPSNRTAAHSRLIPVYRGFHVPPAQPVQTVMTLQ